MDRCYRETDLRLKATKVEFYEGRPIMDPKKPSEILVLEDNGTRMQGTKLLAEINQLRHKQIGIDPGTGTGVLVVRGGQSKSEWEDAARKQQSADDIDES